MYDFYKRIHPCYQLLQDELSKNIFWARLACDFEPSPENIGRLVSLGEQNRWLKAFLEDIPNIVRTLDQDPKKLVLYGTNVTGHVVGQLFIENHVDFYGFCGRRFQEFPNGLLGKPVISPDELFRHPDDFYVVLSVAEATDEILGILRANHFPQAQILSQVKPAEEEDTQYFAFPHLFRPGTAFVDCGCLDCRTSYAFAEWCRDTYSKIFAFEPDPISYSICERNLSARPIRDIRLIQAGLSDQNGEMSFRTGLYGCSHIVTNGGDAQDNLVTVRVAAIDDVAGEEEIGFIKMDIEGSEFRALHGARNVITRDKPLLAISVYHCRCDMPAIMEYLHQLVPAYRFCLRHYSIGLADTVLYAAVDPLVKE